MDPQTKEVVVDTTAVRDRFRRPSTAKSLARDGSVWAWDSQSHGQLGDGTVDLRTAPVRVAPLPPAVSVAAGMPYAVAVLADGTVRAWGANSSSTTGNGERVSEWTDPGASISIDDQTAR